MGKRVLVADDSATIQRAFAMVFGGHQDISLIPARSLDEAVSAARQGRPDLVIADANLAGRTGYELCAAVKSDPGLRGVPVIILASSHAPFDDAKGREAGVDGHLSKPFESQSLIDRVAEILARPVSIAPPARPELAATAPQPVQRADHARPPVASARPPAPAQPYRGDDDEDDYGDFKIERPSGPMAVPAAVRPAAPPAPAAPAPAFRSSPAPAASPVAAMHPTAPVAAPAGLRPSLIPGARPGVPGRLPYAPVPPPPRAAGRARPAAPPATTPAHGTPLSAHGPGRTIMGLPAVAIPGVPPLRPTGPPASPVAPTPGMTAPPSAPVAPPASRFPAAARPAPGGPVPLAPVPSNQLSAPELGAAFAQKIDQKVAAIAARGPEYEAVARLSREIIEQVVWEVVPELAEVIIREHVERLAAARK
jgi:CheY-like chemotaxis protein